MSRLSRRTFLRTSAAGGAPVVLSSAAGAPWSGGSTVSVPLIGEGRFSAVRVLDRPGDLRFPTVLGRPRSVG